MIPTHHYYFAASLHGPTFDFQRNNHQKNPQKHHTISKQHSVSSFLAAFFISLETKAF
jgi:hypothetical protein